MPVFFFSLLMRVFWAMFRFSEQTGKLHQTNKFWNTGAGFVICIFKDMYDAKEESRAGCSSKGAALAKAGLVTTLGQFQR